MSVARMIRDTANRLLGFGVSYRLCHEYCVKGRVNFVVTA